MSEYYDLIEVIWKDGKVGHIPVPMVANTWNSDKETWNKWSPKDNVLTRMLAQAEREVFPTRGDEFFDCIRCGETNFFDNCDCTDEVSCDELAKRKYHVIKAFHEGKGLPLTIKDMFYIRTSRSDICKK